MVFLWIGIGAVVVLMGAAGWTDLQARRRGRPITGIDRTAGREAHRAAETEFRQRTHNQGQSGGFF
jgi:hypothetical protein